MVIEGVSKSGAVTCTACLVLKDAFAPLHSERVPLEIERLIVGGDAGVASR